MPSGSWSRMFSNQPKSFRWEAPSTGGIRHPGVRGTRGELSSRGEPSSSEASTRGEPDTRGQPRSGFPTARSESPRSTAIQFHWHTRSISRRQTQRTTTDQKSTSRTSSTATIARKKKWTYSLGEEIVCNWDIWNELWMGFCSGFEERFPNGRYCKKCQGIDICAAPGQEQYVVW